MEQQQIERLTDEVTWEVVDGGIAKALVSPADSSMVISVGLGNTTEARA